MKIGGAVLEEIFYIRGQRDWCKIISVDLTKFGPKSGLIKLGREKTDHTAQIFLADLNLHLRRLYRISSVKRREFFSFQNNPRDLDPSCKVDLDPCDCLGRVKLIL